ncbi:hypothetical protein GCM10022277_28840 [Litoribacillus peritrichatus]|uniref:Uncharacterized protein n=1 Tax=Litoribacillus peritrichatus TaxID=718191 RepID=A0ABP7MUH5_9GAMM
MDVVLHQANFEGKYSLDLVRGRVIGNNLYAVEASDSALKNTVINGQGNEVKAVIGVRLLDEINVLTHVIQGQD